MTSDALAVLKPRALRQLPEERAIRGVYPCTFKGKDGVLVLASGGVFAVASNGWFATSAPLHVSWLRGLGGQHCDLRLYGEHLKLESSAAEAQRAVREVGELTEAQRQRNRPDALRLEPDERLIRRCVFLGGAKVDLAVRTRVDLFFTADELQVHRSPLQVRDQDPITRLPYVSQFNVELSGPGRFTTGGGFVGGGFGLVGAAEGMAIASLLNVMTTRTHVVSVIAVLSAEYEGFFLCQEHAPDELRRGLAPVFLRARQLGQGTPSDSDSVSPPSSASPGSPDLAATLERLAALHQAGALTDAEFQQAKAQALGI